MKESEGGISSFKAKNQSGKKGIQRKNYPPYKHYGKMGHLPFKCYKRLDAKCSQCNQLGHEAIIYKNKMQQHKEEAKAADQEEEDHLFIATCFSSETSNGNWLIDSGCTNHMIYDKELFKDLNKTTTTKVRVGNGAFITMLRKGNVAIPTYSSTKLLQDVLQFQTLIKIFLVWNN